MASLWWDCLNANPFRPFWWRQEHFVPEHKKFICQLALGMHRADERQCLPFVHSNLWWLRGFSCSGPSLTHMALDGGHWKRLGTWICSLKADFLHIFFSRLLTEQHFLVDSLKWMSGDELQRVSNWGEKTQRPCNAKKVLSYFIWKRLEMCAIPGLGWKECGAGPEAWTSPCLTTKQQRKEGEEGRGSGWTQGLPFLAAV